MKLLELSFVWLLKRKCSFSKGTTHTKKSKLTIVILWESHQNKMKMLAFQQALCIFFEQTSNGDCCGPGNRCLNVKQVCWRVCDLGFWLCTAQRQKRLSVMVPLGCLFYLFPTSSQKQTEIRHQAPVFTISFLVAFNRGFSTQKKRVTQEMVYN